MTARRVGRNEPCPCGSGKKYKQCCYHKAYSFTEDEQGTIRRTIPINDELESMLHQTMDSLDNKDDPDALLFPGINLEQAEFEMTRVMEKAGVDPAIIYAFQETGLLLTEENLDQFSQIDIDLWQSKIEEYRHKQGSTSDPEKFPVGTTALYGPDDKITTKIVAAVILHSDAEPIIERFVGSKVTDDPKVRQSILEFFQKYRVKSVVATQGNIGCPHEEGEDFPVGGDCPFCPFWKGKQGSGASF